MRALILSAVFTGMSLSCAWAAPVALSDGQLDNVAAGNLVDIVVNVPINISNNLNTAAQTSVGLALAGSIFGDASAIAGSLNVNLTGQVIGH